MEICNKLYCTGCGACANLCPVGCIVMKEDEIGHLYPITDESKCVNCGLCRKKCPINNEINGHITDKVYAAWSLDENDRKSSTSGGFASVASKVIIEDGGVVYGSALTETGIEHIRVDDVAGLERLKGSKYVQSPAVHIYTELKKDLEEKRDVLFIGTPCQVAGIHSYLGQDYENLYLVDLICTGVPPQKLLWEHLGYPEKKPQKLCFRDETGSRLTVTDNGRTVYQKPVYNDYFFMGFSKHLYFRESCYNCKFARDERNSDITIGDFWGLGKKIPFEYSQKDGVSVVLLHTEKGKNLFKKCEELLFFQERTEAEATDSNVRYTSPSGRHQNSDKFRKMYVKNGFKKALKCSLRKERVRYLIYRMLRKVKHFF